MRYNRAALIAVGVIVSLSVIAMALLYCWFEWPIGKLSRYTISATWNGVLVVHPDGQAAEYALPTMDGHLVESPQLAFVDDTFLYWSQRDQAICLIRKSPTPPKWFRLPKEFASRDWVVKRISTDGRFALVDSVKGDRLSWVVLLLDLRDGRWKQIDKVRMARIDSSGSGRIIALTSDGCIELHVGSGQRKVVVPKVGDEFDSHWDYDFDTNTLYILDGQYYRIIANGRIVARLEMPVTWSGDSLCWQRGYREVWASALNGFPILQAGKSPVFSAGGKYLGCLRIGSTGDTCVRECDTAVEQLLSDNFSEIQYNLYMKSH